MTTLLFVRHGESRSNENGYFTGQTDVPLSALGKRQALALRDHLLTHYTVDAICSSDLRRACETVLPVAQALGLPVRKERLLREIDGGAWEEKTPAYIAEHFPRDYALWQENIGLARCTGGESMQEVQRRGIAITRRIAAENEGKTVLVGTHAGFLRAMQCFWQHLPPAAMQQIPWVPNASLTEVRYAEGKEEIVRLAEDRYLQGEVTRLSPGI